MITVNQHRTGREILINPIAVDAILPPSDIAPRTIVLRSGVRIEVMQNKHLDDLIIVCKVIACSTVAPNSKEWPNDAR